MTRGVRHRQWRGETAAVSISREDGTSTISSRSANRHDGADDRRHDEDDADRQDPQHTRDEEEQAAHQQRRAVT